MKSETTLLEIYKWLSEGKKIRRDDFEAGYFLQIINNAMYDSECDEVWYQFVGPEKWSLYQEPEEKVKWFGVTSFAKCQSRPYKTNGLCKSKDDYLTSVGAKESDYHWILLEEVKYE